MLFWFALPRTAPQYIITPSLKKANEACSDYQQSGRSFPTSTLSNVNSVSTHLLLRITYWQTNKQCSEAWVLSRGRGSVPLRKAARANMPHDLIFTTNVALSPSPAKWNSCTLKMSLPDTKAKPNCSDDFKQTAAPIPRPYPEGAVTS